MLRQIILLLVLSSSAALAGPKVSVNSLQRPSLFDFDQTPASELDGIVSSSAVSQYDSTILNMYASIAEEVMTNYPEHRYIVLGRDCEYMHDSLEAAMLADPKSQRLIGKSTLVDLSRIVRDNSSYAQIRAYLRSLGIVWENIIEGKEKYLIIDSAGRGTIFRTVMSAIIDAIPQDADFQRKVLNVVEGVSAKLFASKTSDNKSQVVSRLRSSGASLTKREAMDLIGSMGFGNLNDGKWSRYGAPEDSYSRDTWVVNNVELRPHWNSKGVRLSEDGTRIVETKPNTNQDRHGSLQFMRKIYDHFKQSSQVQRFSPLVSQLPTTNLGCQSLGREL